METVREFVFAHFEDELAGEIRTLEHLCCSNFVWRYVGLSSSLCCSGSSLVPNTLGRNAELGTRDSFEQEGLFIFRISIRPSSVDFRVDEAGGDVWKIPEADVDCSRVAAFVLNVINEELHFPEHKRGTNGVAPGVSNNFL